MNRAGAMNYPIWAIFPLIPMPMLSNLGGGAKSDHDTARREIAIVEYQTSESYRTTLRLIPVVRPVFTVFVMVQGFSALSLAYPLILPDLCARNSERNFFSSYLNFPFFRRRMPTG